MLSTVKNKYVGNTGTALLYAPNALDANTCFRKKDDELVSFLTGKKRAKKSDVPETIC